MNKEASRIKLNDYHAIISCIMEDFIKLQSNGFVLDLPTLTNNKIRATAKAQIISMGSLDHILQK